MKKLITLLMLGGSALLTNSANAQQPQHEWTSTFNITSSNVSDNNVYAITSDRYGNLYAYMHTSENLSFNNGNLLYNVATPGIAEYFIVKYNKDGVALWFKKMDSDLYFYEAATDSAGNLFLAGRFSGTMDIDPGTGTVNITSTGGGSDAMIAKYDSAGNYVAHTLIPGQSWVETSALTVDHQGNVVTAGIFPGGCYMAKYNNALSTNLWNDAYQGGATINAISCAPNGDMYIAAELVTNGSVTFGSVGIVQNFVGNYSMFRGKISSAGVEQWGEVVSGGNVHFSKLQVVATGNGVFYSGLIPTPSFQETINFDDLGSAGADVLVTVATQFIVEYNEAGEFQNVMSLPGYGYDNFLQGDLFGNVYSSAMFYGQNVDVDPGPGTFNISSDNVQAVMYLIKLDSTFSLVGAGALGYYTDANRNRMSVNAFGDIYHLGAFQNTLDFDFSTGTANTTATTMMDGFLVKTTLCNISGGFSNQVTVAGGTATAAQAGAIYQWLDCDNSNAPIAGATSQSYTPSAAGNFSVVLSISGCHDTSACTYVDPLSVKNISALGNAVVYPNPASDVINIEHAEKGTEIALSDLTGKVLYRATIGEAKHTINTQAFTSGMYILTATTNGSTYANKVLIK
ncbi:MAG: T9SS type A sorting domain-containing protein [Flavipsychrobacter sp.]|nr:T9SS type A sorting domain-containing protein [Flavipsychrobacter sp.]